MPEIPVFDNGHEMELQFKHNSLLGEGLVWHAATARWWWTDIESSALHSWSAKGNALHSFRLPDRAGSFVHCQSGAILIGFTKRLAFARTSRQRQQREADAQLQLQIQTACAVDPTESRTRINDGRCDRRGFYVFGTMNEATEKRAIGSFYQYSQQHGLRRLALPAVAIANSICFSVDGRTMYFSDTLTRRIMQCDYDSESAQVDNIRLFATLSETGAYPDGAVIDSDGCLWNAQWGAASVQRYSPLGELMQRWQVPAKNPTCPAFGELSLRNLLVTSSRQEMSPQENAAMPDAGSLFGIALPDVVGVPETLFDDSH
ncbi:SMP-30/gluconolactonase/LRE family protein [Sapientia aquatica]|uniref:SMP-30/gluconolactonase/LRE family protein n=1 Tax=Sapientia aquatica TaxID=1549640 RepID=A0A4R5VRQ2_9BURK|nr:SMP-30/gluconolactonase/LRE family protein [Sapientia aquatica]TDK60451.1 SMP-30/gluconolactonase/LRE family protein [Sapientia aquatica]